MNWTEMLKTEMEQSYKATRGLLDQVDEGTMDWKPATGENWMNQGQLLRHITNACGAGCRGFVTGDSGQFIFGVGGARSSEWSNQPTTSAICRHNVGIWQAVDFRRLGPAQRFAVRAART